MSIVLLVSVIAGTQQKIEEEINSIGSNVFMIAPGNLEESHGPPGGSFTINKLKMKHIELIESTSSYGARACPIFIIMGGTVKYKRESRNTTMIAGVYANFPYVRNWGVSYGKFFKNEDVNSSRKVAIVGETIVNDLFKGTEPLGKEIYVEGRKLTVIGVSESKGRTFGQDNDDLVAMPITTAQEILGSNTINQIIVKVPNTSDVEKSMFEVKRLLLKEMDKEDFTITSQGELLDMFNTFANVLSVVMGCVASISLIVGGIGIMNIMLVTVKERIREIGIRKAVGATFLDIMIQFMVESAVISITGGLLGILIAVTILEVSAPYIPFPLKASFTSIVVAFVFSSLIGIFFGTYPAVKAAKTDPIVALRYE
jgi:putative ABC transport system permease protein